ncbi:MAG: enoyl-CoA hydratase/isomerase family protein [candidate division NC10 bacterium]|nr:enoyl-CoA hydratase/isomerase family protein [candidate division NC10 bacterium]
MAGGEGRPPAGGRAAAVQPRSPEAYQFQDILYGKKEWIARITINRPRSFNSYTTATLQEMTLAFQDASWDDAVAVVVLTGAGDKAFCTGGDVKEYAEVYTRRPRDYWKYMGIFSGAIDAVRNCGKPVIARLNGIVAGGGNEFNMACDLAVAAEHATLRQVGTRVGSVAAGGATQWLPIHIGDRRAREMLFTCDDIPARQALDWGLVNRVVPGADLDKAVDDLAQKIIDKFPECTRYTKQQVNFWKDLSWHATVGHARDWLSLHFMSPEPYEGMTAFVEKRAPRYRELRQRAAEGRSSEFLWGPYTRACASCGAKGIPEEFDFCGKCGATLA